MAPVALLQIIVILNFKYIFFAIFICIHNRIFTFINHAQNKPFDCCSCCIDLVFNGFYNTYGKKFMKKFLKIFTIYLLSIVLFFVVAEAFLFCFSFYKQKKVFKKWTVQKQFEKYFEKSDYEISGFKSERFRKDIGTDYNKKSVLIFGCSHLFGAGLEDEQTFGYKLSQATKRPVYNRAFWAWGPQYMLYLLKSKRWIEDIKPPEYVITMFIPDYYQRLYLHQGWPFDSGVYLRYKIDKNDNLKLLPTSPYPWYWRFLTVKYLQYYLENKETGNSKYTDKLYLKIMLESIDTIKKRYPGAKVILLLYEGGAVSEEINPYIMKNSDYFNSKPFSPETLKELEKAGYIVINMEEFVGHSLKTKEYKLEGDPTHPSEKVWDEFVPLLKDRFSM